MVDFGQLPDKPELGELTARAIWFFSEVNNYDNENKARGGTGIAFHRDNKAIRVPPLIPWKIFRL
jgi:hypothetical protein